MYKGCTLCYNSGWVFETQQNHAGVTMEIIPCPIPDCKLSGQLLQLVSVDRLRMHECARHPKDGYIMSLKTGRSPASPGHT